MPVMPMPSRGSRSTAEELRDLMHRDSLTQREVAQIACVSLKTVESWLADPAAVSHRTMPPRHLHIICHMLPSYLAARKLQGRR